MEICQKKYTYDSLTAKLKKKKKILFSPKFSYQLWVPQPPIRWVPGPPPTGGKVFATLCSPITPATISRLKNDWSCTSTSPVFLRGLNKDRFTFFYLCLTDGKKRFRTEWYEEFLEFNPVLKSSVITIFYLSSSKSWPVRHTDSLLKLLFPLRPTDHSK